MNANKKAASKQTHHDLNLPLWLYEKDHGLTWTVPGCQVAISEVYAAIERVQNFYGKVTP
jgi:hypothetical protein